MSATDDRPAWLSLIPPRRDLRPKVFCIGFHKTGTSSVGKALEGLGYRVHPGFGFNRPRRVRIEPPVTRDKLAAIALRQVPHYSAFQDNPWPLLYRHVDEHVPGSKFILTRRDPQRWLASAQRYFGRRMSTTHELLYGPGINAVDHPDVLVARLKAHDEEVLAYFGDRDDLLVIGIEDIGWEPICRFLGRPVPERPFPHLNATGGKGRVSLRRVIRQALGM